MRSKYSPRRIAFLMAGCLALILGIVGAFLPILPTTPFMLLAAFCFARSSQKAFCWLMTHSLFGFKIYSYSVTHAIPKGVKWKIFFVLWISLFISMLFIPLWWVRILLVGVGVGVTIHIARLRTIAPEEIALYKEQYEAYKARWECNRKK
ncbi:YbaN family protein [Porphyromonas gingivicanis]|uniref:YbaN family protein n=1 Tax=Porphyromonas gingivicanis TaxID=266762 RepID=UPI00068D1A4D|nr:YbaN family protein [Porphyromonas gingivicanis]